MKITKKERKRVYRNKFVRKILAEGETIFLSGTPYVKGRIVMQNKRPIQLPTVRLQY